ncbi:hypothetical protein [Paraburkholderia sp. DGU8]|uniref:hypothetical protein n=1 Tax=Paraburkholderia sp. DGU8 TaxID=3161997 RepID=UPI003465FAFA
MKLVRIKRHHREYTPGDITGFGEAHAQRLIDAGIAEEHVPEATEVKEANEPKAAARGDASKSAAAKG